MNKTTKNQKTHLFYALLKKTPIAMRITLLLLLVLTFQLQAEHIYSQDTKISLNLKNSTIEKVLQTIEEKSDYYFLYNNRLIDVDRKVSVRVKNAAIGAVLDRLFKSGNVDYEVKGSQIILSPKEMYSQITAIAESMQQQKKAITGTVVDAAGVPIIGANIIEAGTTNGTVTDVDGKFSLSVENNAIIRISYIGYLEQDINTERKTSFDITLLEDTQALDEVIVVGYGTQAKRNLTGSVSDIKSEAIVRSNATVLSQSIAGKVQGISTRATDVRPGRGIRLQIRNMGTPLFVIDGIPYGGKSGRTSYTTPIVSGEDIFNSLSIEDIESVSFLKDASAAIYGLRASNGVVLVTTKKGRKNENVVINVNAYYGWQNFTRYPQPANAGQYVRSLLESEQNLGRDPSLLYSREELAKWEAGTDPLYKSYNYYDIIMRKNVPQNHINVNTSGGSDRSKYYISLSNDHQDAIIKEYSWGKTNLQMNLETNLAKGLTVGAQISGVLDKTKSVGVPGTDDYMRPLNSVLRMWPIESPYANDNPDYVNLTHLPNFNPAIYNRNISGFNDITQRMLNTNLFVQYDFKFGLSLKGTYSYNYQNLLMDSQEYTYSAYVYNKETDEYKTQPNWGNQSPWRGQEKRDVTSSYAQIQLNYKKTFNDHNFVATASAERSDYDNTYLYTQANPTNNYIPIIQLSEITRMTNDWLYEARAGYIGRVNYDYNGRYLLELLGRYDGSYLYSPGKRWGFFPGVSLGWRISDESFFEKLKSVVDDLKIRASYGQTGSESGVSMHGYLDGYNFNQGNAILDDNYVIGLKPRGLPVTNLSWVTNTTTNIGIDLALFNRSLSVTADIFQKKRTGLPASRYDVVLPSEVGYTLPNENLNSDVQKGFEAIVTYLGSVNKLNYSLSGNISLSRLKILETYKPRFSNSWDEYRNSKENRWNNILWGYKTVGRFQNMDEINNYPVNIDGQGNRTLLPGDLIYEDFNGDGIINSFDNRPIGYATGTTPFLTLGFNTGLEWRNFNLNMDFAGGAMQSLLRKDQLKIPYFSDGSAPEKMLTDRWHQEDPYDNNSRWIPGYYPAIRKGNTNHSNFWTSDFWLTNIRYLRLKNIELGYALPKDITSKMNITRMRIYLNMSNIFSLDNVKKFEIDPEIAAGGGNIYPQQKLVMLGVNVSF